MLNAQQQFMQDTEGVMSMCKYLLIAYRTLKMTDKDGDIAWTILHDGSSYREEGDIITHYRRDGSVITTRDLRQEEEDLRYEEELDRWYQRSGY